MTTTRFLIIDLTDLTDDQLDDLNNCLDDNSIPSYSAP